MFIEGEIYKDIPGYEGLYMISDTGKVKSLPRVWYSGKYGQRRHEEGERELKPVYRHGYCCCTLYNSKGESERWAIHRLVAIVFIPNPYCKPHINHIDHVRDNNRVENLEWVTIAENNRHSPGNKIPKEEYEKIRRWYITEEKATSEMASMYNVSTSTILSILKGIKKHKQIGRIPPNKGKKMSDEVYAKYIQNKRKSFKKIMCVETGRVYGSVKEATEAVGASDGHISKHLKGKFAHVKGFTFVYYKNNIDEN